MGSPRMTTDELSIPADAASLTPRATVGPVGLDYESGVFHWPYNFEF